MEAQWWTDISILLSAWRHKKHGVFHCVFLQRGRDDTVTRRSEQVDFKRGHSPSQKRGRFLMRRKNSHLVWEKNVLLSIFSFALACVPSISIHRGGQIQLFYHQKGAFKSFFSNSAQLHSNRALSGMSSSILHRDVTHWIKHALTWFLSPNSDLWISRQYRWCVRMPPTPFYPASPRLWAGRVVVNACLFCIMHAPIRLIYAAGRIPILYYYFYSILYGVADWLFRLEGKCWEKQYLWTKNPTKLCWMSDDRFVKWH